MKGFRKVRAKFSPPRQHLKFPAVQANNSLAAREGIGTKNGIPRLESSHVSAQTMLLHNPGHDCCLRGGREVRPSHQGIGCTEAEYAAARSGAWRRSVALVQGPTDKEARPIALGQGIARGKRN